MRISHRIVLGLTMCVALGFGFVHLLAPGFAYDFDRLHVFLFNLCAGGVILLYQGQGRRVSWKLHAHFALSLAYAIGAFLEQYLVPVVLSVPMLLLVESVRIRRFGSFFPWRFFRRAPISDKFLEAALLCLSIGTGIATLVILNNEHLHLVHLDKLSLDVFFLGYSFPLSLLTMSVMFTFTDEQGGRSYGVLKEVGFWSITVGVIAFFFFIIFEVTAVELVVANALLASVCMVYWLFVRHSKPVQQRSILVSGMAFLVLTGVTGVLYLLEYLYPPIEAWHDYFLTWHATVALYGWNLSGLFIVVRWDDFPITRNTWLVILLHWATVLVLAPLGSYSLVAAALALPVYTALVIYVFFGKARGAEIAGSGAA